MLDYAFYTVLTLVAGIVQLALNLPISSPNLFKACTNKNKQEDLYCFFTEMNSISQHFFIKKL